MFAHGCGAERFIKLRVHPAGPRANSPKHLSQSVIARLQQHRTSTTDLLISDPRKVPVKTALSSTNAPESVRFRSTPNSQCLCFGGKYIAPRLRVLRCSEGSEAYSKHHQRQVHVRLRQVNAVGDHLERVLGSNIGLVGDTIFARLEDISN